MLIYMKKDPSGGTTGRVKPYGRLGWMGARAEYSQREGRPLHAKLGRAAPPDRSKANQFFRRPGTSPGYAKSRHIDITKPQHHDVNAMHPVLKGPHAHNP
jgi:hypothetical protein